MKPITRQQAEYHLQTNRIGFYAIWANPPLLSEEQIYVVQIGDDFYLTEVNELKLEFVGSSVINGVPKDNYLVEVYNIELGNLLQNVAQECPRINLGIDVPTYYSEPSSEANRKS